MSSASEFLILEKIKISAPSITSLRSTQMLLLGISLSKLFLRVQNLNIGLFLKHCVILLSSAFIIYYSVFHTAVLNGVTKITVKKE